MAFRLRRFLARFKPPDRGPLVFLDVDGVLNGHRFDWAALSNTIDQDKVMLLNLILTATGARVVLSTAWRYILFRREANLAGLDWLFRSHGLMAGRLHGATRADRMMPRSYSGDRTRWPVENERGRQIAEWREDHRHVGRYVVIDDLDLGISAAGHPFVQTDGKSGLADSDAMKAISILIGQPCMMDEREDEPCSANSRPRA